MSAVTMQIDRATAGVSRQDELRSACNALVGMAMFAPMLKEARGSSLNGELFKSSGTRMWQSQFDDVLIQTMSERDNSLGDVLYERFAKALDAKIDADSRKQHSADAGDKTDKLDVKG